MGGLPWSMVPMLKVHRMVEVRHYVQNFTEQLQF